MAKHDVKARSRAAVEAAKVNQARQARHEPAAQFAAGLRKLGGVVPLGR